VSREARFSTLIVTFNNCSDILPLLEDIHAQAPPPLNRIIVVDNASVDGTACLIKRHFPDVCLIPNHENVGFGKAVNQGFGLCNTSYFFLLNPDIRIPHPGFLARMIECIDESSSIAAVGPMQFKQFRDRLRLTFTWSYWNPRAFRLFVWHRLRRQIPDTLPIAVTFLNAGCLLVRSSAFRRSGMFSEKYFLYGEEPDLFLKFKEQGYQCHLIPSTHVIHHREHSIRTLSTWPRTFLKLSAVFKICHALLIGSVRIVRRRWRQTIMRT
jgi:GT2 family glycosyltransferase